MTMALSVDADLDFSIDIPGSGKVTGSLTGSGTRLQLQVSDPFLFAGRRDAGAIRALADGLAARNLSLTVVTPAGPLVTLGGTRTRWVQHRLTGSRHIRIERAAGLWQLLRGRTQAPAAGALPTTELLPPRTLFPLVPTLRRQRRRPVTTTHDPGRGGNPCLIMAPPPAPRVGERRQVFPLRDDVTTIGSDESCDIRLVGLAPVHAEIRHDDEDEFVLFRLAASRSALVNGVPIDSALLRTASRVQLGDWTMSFYREEYADHGRPHGGRIGGELGHQRPQAPRQAGHERKGDDR